MNTIYLIVFFVSLICLVIGLVKPTYFSRFIKGEITKKKIIKIFGLAALISFILFGATGDSLETNNSVINQPITENPKITSTVEEAKKDTVPIVSKKDVIPTPPVPKAITTSTPTLITQTDRTSILVILKDNASKKWGTDYQMVKYEYDSQVKAYDWVVSQTKYPDIMAKAKQKWGNDFKMVQYEYNNQVEAYEWVMEQTQYLDIMAKAKQKWGTDYTMVKYEYNNQVEAYKSL